jgi:asparagine N-glycosylation enzyme membrane subunit Stt3
MDALVWIKNNLPATTVICSWWDYGYWLTILGNVTSLADNATVNNTQIGLIGRTYMSNETQAVRILKEQFNGPHGPPAYILVFTTFAKVIDSSGNVITVTDYPVGGDEGKWTWMARIANSSRTVRELHKDEWGVWEYKEWGTSNLNNTFGYSDSKTGLFVWNDLGKNTTIYKLMENGKHSQVSEYTAPTLTYFKNGHFFGGQVSFLGTDSSGYYHYLYAAVCLYEVDYAKYDLEH